jgi:hypothetical protein
MTSIILRLMALAAAGYARRFVHGRVAFRR